MLTLVIGGSGSGKSSFGEKLAQESNSKLYYLATMIPYGDEGKRRVERHLKLRKGKGFETIEEYMDIGSIDIPYGSCVLLEDLTNLVANNMFTKNPQKDINMFIVNGIVQLYNKVENITSKGLDYNQDKRALYDRWTTPGQQAQFKKISLVTSTPMSSRFVQDDNTLALESFRVGYEFEPKKLSRYGLRSLRLNAYMNDVFKISSIKTERGIEYPFARSVSFSVAASF